MIFRFKTKAASGVANDAGMASAEGTPAENGVQDESTPAPANGSTLMDGLVTTAPSGMSIASNAQSGAAPVGDASPMPSSPEPTPDEIRFAIQFARITSVLMRSPHYKHYTLADLEWLVVPPTLFGQCVIMDANSNGRSTPVAAALWAFVSEDVDKKISESQTVPIKLRPDEWRSGDILWLVDAVGDNRVLPTFLKHLRENVFNGQKVKMRTRS